MKSVSILMMAAVLAAAAQAGLMTWVGKAGGGDGFSTFQEANWSLDGGTVPANTINPNTPVQHDMRVNDSAALVGGGGAAAGNWVIGDGYTLTVTAGEVKMAAWAAMGILGVNGGAPSYLDIAGGFVSSHFLRYDLLVTLGGDGELRITGGDNPISDGAAIDLTSADAVLHFTNETVDDFLAEHLSKVTVKGNPAVVDKNISVVSDENTGCYVTIAGVPSNPVPENGEIAVLTTTDLSWDAPQDLDLGSRRTDILSFYVYMVEEEVGQEPNALNYVRSDAIADPGSDPVTALNAELPLMLQPDKQYYWYVEAALDNGTGNAYPAGDPNNLVGRTWTFETLTSTPVVTAQPASVLLDNVGQMVEFRFDATTASLGSYQWYWSPDVRPVYDPETNTMTPAGSAVGAEGLFFPPSGTGMLTLNNVQWTDQGFYYGKVWNATGESEAAYTDVVQLGVKQHLAHWTLDSADFVSNQYRDISGNEHHADPNDPSAVAGAQVEGIAGQGVAINAGTWANAGSWLPHAHTNEMTVSAWVKVTGTLANLHGIVSKRTDGTTAEWGLFARSGDGTHPGTNYVRFLSWQGGGQLWSNQDALVPNEWVHVVGTVDAFRVSRLYINGVQQGQGTNWPFGDGTSAPILLGKVGDHNLFPGNLDDIQIWNYAKDKYGVIDLYHGLTGKSVCADPLPADIAVFDIDKDCKIDLQDFAEFATAWLRCGLYPDCN